MICKMCYNSIFLVVIGFVDFLSVIVASLLPLFVNCFCVVRVHKDKDDPKLNNDDQYLILFDTL